jgi:hypothetical protein
MLHFWLQKVASDALSSPVFSTPGIVLFCLVEPRSVIELLDANDNLRLPRFSMANELILAPHLQAIQRRGISAMQKSRVGRRLVSACIRVVLSSSSLLSRPFIVAVHDVVKPHSLQSSIRFTIINQHYTLPSPNPHSPPAENHWVCSIILSSLTESALAICRKSLGV